ncbi:hypothetical protein [Parahaliea aestuarii]|uniref:Uncharacterized protein n=1 Tax=Parahaliea aestuarii TaxID=1852021 RepID=A0A5C9A1I4_9GAMM|nr:hypothetical protein [Parahaliea aestuarii]TXS93487.1 hypothetical protein FVW59_06560 [Parahaliea aestuarii]
MRRLRWPHLTLGAGAWLLLMVCSVGLSDWSIRHQVHSELGRQLPELLADAIPGWEGESFSWRHLAMEIDRDLVNLQLRQPGPLAHCSARVLSLQGEQIARAGAGEQRLALAWRQGEMGRQLELGLQCQRNWPWLLASQGALTGLVAALLLALPAPLSARRRAYVDALRTAGASRRQALRATAAVDDLSDSQIQLLDALLAQAGDGGLNPQMQAFRWAGSVRAQALTAAQLPWFLRALQLFEGDAERALAVALAPAQLVFHPRDCRVSVHGLDLRLPSTPFIYYLWYARRRLRDGAGDAGGWFANPPSNRADHEGAAEVLALMEAYEGHGKAARDLREKGLRSRTLDQNRSKVKEHLTGLLGEELAADFLFEGERDARTARSRYRIVTDAAQIRVDEGPQCAAAGAIDIPATPASYS